MIRPIPQLAVDFVAQHEACKLKAYADVGGVWTIGYGHTLGIQDWMTCTEQQARFWLEEDLRTAGKRLYGVVDEAVILKLSEHQYAALLSFVFNCGCSPSWTIWKRVNAGDLELVPKELMRFVYAGGRLIPGLVNRRSAERDLWYTADGRAPVSEPQPSSPVTRDAVTPEPHPGFFQRILSRFAA